ncbi:MAG: flagellar assembly protein FliH [Candidatus Obscuribacterales bacterium]|nr:flagellar assembly protein FliH [Steroidobacteraceae bacterium]
MSERASPTTLLVAERWSPPAVEGPAFSGRRERGGKEQSRQERAIHEQARAAGYAAGIAEFQARNADLALRVKRLDDILNLLSRPLTELDAQVERQLVTLSLTVARHLVRRELRIDPTQVIGIIRDAVALLPAAARNVRVHLHPEDATLVREHLAEPQTERAWTIVEDPVAGRGGCRITTDTAHIDARLETRLGQAISQVLGSERGQNRDEQNKEGEA